MEASSDGPYLHHRSCLILGVPRGAPPWGYTVDQRTPLSGLLFEICTSKGGNGDPQPGLSNPTKVVFLSTSVEALRRHSRKILGQTAGRHSKSLKGTGCLKTFKKSSAMASLHRIYPQLS